MHVCKQFKNELYRYALNSSFYSVKEFLEFSRDNKYVNYSCCNLYCIISLYYAQYLILETVVLTSVYCTVLCFLLCLFVYYVFFLTSFISDCCMTEFVDLRNDLCACMYVLSVNILNTCGASLSPLPQIHLYNR